MKKIKINNEKVKVFAQFHEEGSVLRGDKQGEVDGFEIHVSMDSEESKDTINEMLILAHRMCFTEAAIKQSVPVKSFHKINGEELQIKES